MGRIKAEVEEQDGEDEIKRQERQTKIERQGFKTGRQGKKARQKG